MHINLRIAANPRYVMNSNSMRVMAIALLCLCAGCNGCNSSSVQIDESPVIVLDGEKGRVQAKVGGGTVTLPADFPADLPQYQAAELLLVSSSPKGVTVSLRAAEPVEKVSEFYMTALAEKGWAAPQKRSSGGTHVISATKENRRAVVSIAEDSGKSLVTLSVTPTD
jgi:hypothetical protein